jgi:hypothetical protein
LKYFPNPIQGKVNLELSSAIGEVNVVVRDIGGKTIKQVKWNTNDKQGIQLDLSGQTQGSYVLEIGQNSGMLLISKMLYVR